MHKIFFKLGALCCAAALFTGCASKPVPYDYTAFRESRPHSILVLPPLNQTPDIAATYGVFSQVGFPLAESGYYVFPVTLVDETFKQNGLTTAGDIHAVAPAKLREIFGADAALYITVTKYGAVYTVLNSEVIVSAKARLVDLKSGKLLWEGSAVASSEEGKNNNNAGGIIGMLVTAVVKQVFNNVTDSSYPVAGTATGRLLFAQPNGVLYGPRSPRYQSEQIPQP